MAAANFESSVPGSIKFEYIRILQNESDEQGFDITNIVGQFDWHESIYDHFMHGSFLLSDSLGLQTQLPVIGDEFVEFSYYVPHEFFNEFPITLRGRIVKIEKMTIENARTAEYLINFVSSEKVLDITRRVRKGYMNTPIKSMVDDVYSTYLKNDNKPKPLVTDNTQGNRTLVIPNMHPAQAIQFLASEAVYDSTTPVIPQSSGEQVNETSTYVPNDKNTSNFIFFENYDGFHFKTLDNLIYDSKRKVSEQQGSTGKSLRLTYSLREQDLLEDQNKVRNPYTEAAYDNMPVGWAKLSSYSFNRMFDRVREVLAGKYENKVLIIDPIKQVYREKKLKYAEGFDRMQSISLGAGRKSTGDDSVYSKMSTDEKNTGDAHVRYIIAAEGHNDDIPDSQRQEKLNEVIMSLASLSSISLNITVPGNTRVRAGSIIHIIFPEFGGTDDIMNKTHSLLTGGSSNPGVWFVTHVRHVYNKTDGYSLAIEVVKNNYETESQRQSGGRA